MKKFAAIISIISAYLLFNAAYAARADKPYIFLSSNSNPMHGEDTVRMERRFVSGQKIYYFLVAPKKFKYPGIRMRLTKHDEKTSNWGYTIIQTKDFYINEAEKGSKDYFILRQKGHYLIEFFYLNKKDYPFARTEFLVD